MCNIYILYFSHSIATRYRIDVSVTLPFCPQIVAVHAQYPYPQIIYVDKRL